MRIDISTAYGINLTDETLTEQIGVHLRALHWSQLEIDFSGCILDYPATSKIIDGAFEGLSIDNSEKLLILTFNIPFQERMFIKWYFFGSKLLASDAYNESVENLRECLNTLLRKSRLTLVIRIKDPLTGTLSDLYTYGQ